MVKNIVMSAKGSDGEIQLFEDEVIILRTGAWAHVYGQRTRIAPLSSIHKIEFEKSTIIENGHIQFVLQVNHMPVSGMETSCVNENTVRFANDQENDFVRLTEHIKSSGKSKKENAKKSFDKSVQQQVRPAPTNRNFQQQVRPAPTNRNFQQQVRPAPTDRNFQQPVRTAPTDRNFQQPVRTTPAPKPDTRNEDVKFCMQCGQKMVAADVYCPHCGTMQQTPGNASGVDSKPDRKIEEMKFCVECGQKINARAEICPKCGVRQPLRLETARAPNGKSKITAGLLALFLGGIGVHKFYLGQIWLGFIYLIFFWTYIPMLIGFVEAILLLSMNDEVFVRKYGGL